MEIRKVFTRPLKQLSLLAAFAMVACHSGEPTMGSAFGDPTQAQSDTSTAAATIDVSLDIVQADETVMATVNGSRIGELDFEINLDRTIGDAYGVLVGDEVHDTVLQSMVTSRAIAMKALAAMDDDDRIALEKRVAQFREELLVRDYLLAHSAPESISPESILRYYNENPEEFSGEVIKVVEVLTVSPDQYRSDSQRTMESLSLGKTHNDWRVLATDSQNDESLIPLSHRLLTLEGDRARGRIEEVAQQLQLHEISRIVISDDAPYLLRVADIKPAIPIPFEQAADDIRRKLLPKNVRNAIRTVSKQVLSESQVVLVGRDG